MALPCHLSPYFTYGYTYKNTHPLIWHFRIKSVSYARNVSKIAGEIHRIWWNMSPIKKLSKRDDQLSSYSMSTSWLVDNDAVLPLTSRTCCIEIFDNEPSSGHQVTVEANRHQLLNLLSNCSHSVKKWHIWRDWLMMTIRLLHLLSLWHCQGPNRFITGRGRNWPILENSCKYIMGLVMTLCISSRGNLSFIFLKILVWTGKYNCNLN